MTNAEITKLAKDLKAKKMQAADLADEIAEIEAAIKSEMEARDVEVSTHASARDATNVI